MSKVFIQEETLSNIGSAIREMTGKTDLIAPGNMAAEIRSIETGGGGEVPEVIDIDYYQVQYLNPYNFHNWAMDGKKMVYNCTSNGVTVSSLFASSDRLVDLSKVVIIFNNVSGNNFGEKFFNGCSALEALPELRVAKAESSVALYQTFSGCQRLRIIPEDFFKCKSADGTLLGKSWWTDNNDKSNGSYSVNQGCRDCFSLRRIPELFKTFTKTSSTVYQYTFNNCYALDELVGVPVNVVTSNTNSQQFTQTFDNCHRLKELTFAVQADGAPYVTKFGNSTLDLSSTAIGYAPSQDVILNYNSGITADKRVTNDASYQALKNDPDWWTTDVAYSRYNHDSAVNTINSLPDCSGATNKNIIKFKGASGSKTDGGAISTLTSAEIYVATAKGWTVEIV